ncbi:hypothetical protein ACHWQZ_G019335 [Mnemiopsis leidyi]
MSVLFGILTFVFLLSYTLVTNYILETFRYSKDLSKLYQSTDEDFFFRPKLDRSPESRGRYTVTSDNVNFHIWSSRTEKKKIQAIDVHKTAKGKNDFVVEMLRILEQEDWFSDVWF